MSPPLSDPKGPVCSNTISANNGPMTFIHSQRIWVTSFKQLSGFEWEGLFPKERKEENLARFTKKIKYSARDVPFHFLLKD